MIINWWNLVGRNRSKIWHGSDIDLTQKLYENITNPDWVWWKSGIIGCRLVYDTLKSLSNHSKQFRRLYNNALMNSGDGTERCAKSWSDFFYIPSRFVDDFIVLSKLSFTHQLFLEIAVPTIQHFLDDINNIEMINGRYIPMLTDHPLNFWAQYKQNETFYHPFKWHLGQSKYNVYMVEKKIINMTKWLLKNNRF